MAVRDNGDSDVNSNQIKKVYIENEGSEPSDAQLIEFAKKLGLNILVPPNETTKLNKDLDLSYTNREW